MTHADTDRGFTREVPVTGHEGSVLDCQVWADARDENNGNASHRYRIDLRSAGHSGRSDEIVFQHGPLGEVGVNGLTNEVLLALVIDRLEGFQTSKYACEENAVALTATRAALAALQARTHARAARGVEGTHAV